jgi:hypothetical protein
VRPAGRAGAREREEPLDPGQGSRRRLPPDRDRAAREREDRLLELAQVLHQGQGAAPQADGDDHERSEGIRELDERLFKFKGSNLDRIECRLDNRKWQVCGAGWAMYENLAAGTHVFTVRAYSLDGKSHVDATRTFTVSLPPTGG